MDCHGAARLAMTAGALLRPRLVIASNEAIYRPVHNDMDCHGAARLAMTAGASLRPRPVIAMIATSLRSSQ
jgi:hypothetical protein